MCTISKFSHFLLLSEANPKLKHKIFSQEGSKRPYFFSSEIYRSQSIFEEVNNLLPFFRRTEIKYVG